MQYASVGLETFERAVHVCFSVARNTYSTSESVLPRMSKTVSSTNELVRSTNQLVWVLEDSARSHSLHVIFTHAYPHNTVTQIHYKGICGLSMYLICLGFATLR